MIDIENCKTEIYKVISTDEYIASLGFEPENIQKSMNTPEPIRAENKQIFIYPTVTQKTPNFCIVTNVFEIDVSVPYDQNVAGECMEQIIALLQDYKMNSGKIFQLYDSPREIAGQSGFVVMGVKFSTHSTIYNRIKKPVILN